MNDKVLLSDLVTDIKLEVLAGKKGLTKEITDVEITNPGMEFAGFYSYFIPDRIILIGSKEATYLSKLDKDVAYERVLHLFEQTPPAFVFSTRAIVPDFFIELGEKYNTPVLKSEDRTTTITSKLYTYLRDRLAPRISVHGVLVDINGLGTLITGASGIGKSEAALELIKRGHQLIADDRVDIYEKEVGCLIGYAPKNIQRYLEVRGVGIVNVVEMFGVCAFREDKTVRLVIELKEYNKDTNVNVDRLGLGHETVKFFNSELPKISIPVKAGRNVAVLVEAAAMNAKLKYMGYDAALELTEAIAKQARGEK